MLQNDKYPLDYADKNSKGLTPIMEADMLIKASKN